MIQETSRLAYNNIKGKLSLKQKRVKEALNRIGTATNTELSDFMQLPINCITPRIHELRKKGVVECIRKRSCKITGKTAMVFAVIDAEVLHYNRYEEINNGQVWKGRNA